MNRRSLYILYAALWVVALGLFYPLKSLAVGPLGTLILYGPLIFILYLFSILFLDIREEVIDGALFRRFLKRRQFAIGLFLLGMVILVLLISFT